MLRDGATEQRAVRISDVFSETGRGGLYIKIHFGGEIAPLRVYANSPARWGALFAAADLETPDPANERDVARQVRGLVGAALLLEIQGDRVRRILPPTSEAA
jgi:hypothetical protein